jgi:hypothetical protein
VLARQTGRSLYDFAHDKQDPAWSHYRHLIAHHLPVRGMRAQVMLAGGPCWMEINAEPCHDAGGHFLGYRGTAPH